MFEEEKTPSCRIVDIHTHILPGLDDGAQDWEGAITMAELAVESGTAALVATPHCGLPDQDLTETVDTIRRRLNRFRKFLTERKLPLVLCEGMEIFGTPDTASLLEQGRLLTLNHSRYPLIEFPFEDYGSEATRILEQVRDLGYVPVVAHPERYLYVQDKPELLNLWADMGCLMQVNRGSLVGKFSETAGELAWAMVARGFAFTIASDAHTHYARTPWMQDVRKELLREFTADYVTLLMEKRPLELLRNVAVSMDEPDWF
jgi:protein-tyrosine phosphatase